MSKRKDPKDEAIVYVMSAPLIEASTFVQTLASVVKARQQTAEKMTAGKVAAAAKTDAPTRSRAPLRNIKVSDTSQAPATAEAAQNPTLPGTSTPQ